MAIVKVLRRNCSKYVGKELVNEVSTSLFPKQVSMDVRHGFESMVHSVRELLEDLLPANVDLTTAFFVRRPFFLDKIQYRFPAMFSSNNLFYGAAF